MCPALCLHRGADRRRPSRRRSLPVLDLQAVAQREGKRVARFAGPGVVNPVRSATRIDLERVGRRDRRYTPQATDSRSGKGEDSDSAAVHCRRRRQRDVGAPRNLSAASEDSSSHRLAERPVPRTRIVVAAVRPTPGTSIQTLSRRGGFRRRRASGDPDRRTSIFDRHERPRARSPGRTRIRTRRMFRRNDADEQPGFLHPKLNQASRSGRWTRSPLGDRCGKTFGGAGRSLVVSKADNPAARNAAVASRCPPRLEATISRSAVKASREGL